MKRTNQRIGVKYYPRSSELSINLGLIINKINEAKEMEIILDEHELYVFFSIKHHDCEIKIRQDGEVVIYFNMPLSAKNIDGKLAYALNESDRIISELKEREMVDFELDDKITLSYNFKERLSDGSIINVIDATRSISNRILDKIYINGSGLIFPNIYRSP